MKQSNVSKSHFFNPLIKVLKISLKSNSLNLNFVPKLLCSSRGNL